MKFGNIEEEIVETIDMVINYVIRMYSVNNVKLLKCILMFSHYLINIQLQLSGDNRRQQAVSGINCNTNTVFDTRDKYWYCQTNDRDYEYCCRPGSSCGYSENYEYPW